MVQRQAGADGHRVATEIQQIQKALTAAGFRVRKQPRQPLWIITAPKSQHYRLSFQPAPIRGWVLHPIQESPVRQQIAEIVQSVLAPERVAWQQSFSINELHTECRPWAIVMIQVPCGAQSSPASAIARMQMIISKPFGGTCPRVFLR